MRDHSCEFTRDGPVYLFDDTKVSREEDVKIALLNLGRRSRVSRTVITRECGSTYKRSADGNCPSLISCLHDRSIDALDGTGQTVEVTAEELMSGKIVV